MSDGHTRTPKSLVERTEVPNTPTTSVASVAPAEAVASRARMAASAVTDRTSVDAADAIALAEDVDLDVELRRQLLSMQNREIDHYALLGVEHGVDKKAIKRAYYELAAKFHPDKYFRKKLGSFKLRLEAFFSRLTIAHEVLADAEKRAEYDGYLDLQRRSRSIEQLLADAAREAKVAEENIERQVRAQEAPSVPVGPPSGSGPAAPVRVRIPNAVPPPDVAASVRRDAFARRLLGGRPMTSSAPPPPPSTASSVSMMTAADAMSALRKRYEERVTAAKAAEARKCAAKGEQAMTTGDVITAANAFRLAAGLAPNDADLQRKAGEAKAKADALLADTYTHQAEYEEKSGQWAGAARSWIRVCEARPNDAHAHDHAATALMKAGGDLHEAARLAKRACELEPATAGPRLTLANVYLAANMSQSALREIETAARLRPGDGTIEAMLNRLRTPT